MQNYNRVHSLILFGGAMYYIQLPQVVLKQHLKALLCFTCQNYNILSVYNSNTYLP